MRCKENKFKMLTRRECCTSLGAVTALVGLRALGAEEVTIEPLERFQINNRRYLGNKFKLTGEIRRIVDEYCTDVKTFVDIFAGTGSVASAFPDKRLITNDILYSNYICHVAWFSGEVYSEEKLADLIRAYNAATPRKENYMSDNFADTYFSRQDCRKIGYIREDIEKRFKNREINGRERALLITSLLYAMDKIANTVGHYDAYRKGVSFDRHLRLKLPDPPSCQSTGNLCYSEDANTLTPKLEKVDVFFMDPPYNSRQYGDAYHVLENVARWEKPEVEGVARKMDRSAIKSDYCTRKAEDAFADLVKKIKARYIVLTYNNMADKGNDRSNAKLSDEVILRVLRAKGEVRIFYCDHKAFTTGKSDRDDNQERIFLCECKPVEFIASPLNYTGGKYRILDQLIPHFPDDIETCVDLFCGGCNVGINVKADKVIFTDTCLPLISLFKTMKAIKTDDFIAEAKNLIKRFGLSDTESNGYEFYGCASSAGVGEYNKDRFKELRKHYAGLKDGSKEKSLALYVLIVFAFNNQIRFNSKGEFNLPVGKRDFNSKMQRKLRAFMDRLHDGSYEFRRMDFRKISAELVGKRGFVYADPPYLVTTASYNENGGWSEADEIDLLATLDRIHGWGCRFALSNVTRSNGRTNTILEDWLERNSHYRVIDIEREYTNANYQRKNEGAAHEVLVVNY